jgi:signal transduction histidine kinase
MKFLHRLNLGTKIALLTLPGLILVIAIFGFLYIRSANQVTEMVLQDRLITAGVVEEYIDEVLGQALNEAYSIAQTIEIGETDDSIESQINSLENAYSLLLIKIQNIYIIDNKGSVKWSKPYNQKTIGTNTSHYPSINQTIKEGQSTISALVPNPDNNNPIILISSPIKNEQNEVNGALAVAVDIAQSSISGFVQPIKLGETGYVEVIDQNGTVIARTEPGPKLTPFEKSDHSGRFAELIVVGTPTQGLCHNCHVPVEKVGSRDLLAFVPLDTARWGIVIRQAEEEALTPLREFRQSILLFGVGLIVIALLVIIVTTQDVVRSIGILITASQKIARGDLNSSISSQRRDEIGVLSQNFEDMRIKLKSSYGDLEQRTKELSAILSVSEILTSISDPSNLNTILHDALMKTLEIMQQKIGGILILDDERQLLHYQIHHGLSKEYTQESYWRLGEGISGTVAQTGETIVTEDVSKDPRAAHPDFVQLEGLRAFASVPIPSQDKVLGVLNIASNEARSFSPQDIRLLEGIAGELGTTIVNARLQQDVQNKEEIRGELLREIMTIQEEERRRIARELHDETSQSLASLAANLEAISSTLPADEEKIKIKIKEAQSLSIRILDEIHRLIYELRPSLLDDLGLLAATRWLAENNLEVIGIKSTFKTIGRERRLPRHIESTVFRVVQEAITNIAKHSHAKNADIILHFNKNTIRVNIKNDGKGFDVKEAITSKQRPRGLGLLGMKERVELISGTFTIRSHNRRIGTEIDIEIPIKKGGSNE